MMEDVCRLCLEERSSLDPSSYDDCMDNSLSSEHKLEQLVLQYLPVQVIKTEDFDYPFICTGCTSLIYRWHKFCTSCVENDQIYQEKLHYVVSDQKCIQQEKLMQLKDEIIEEYVEDSRKPGMYLEVEMVNMSEDADVLKNDSFASQHYSTSDSEERVLETKVEIQKKEKKNSVVSQKMKNSPNGRNRLKALVDNIGHSPRKVGRPRIYPVDYKAPPRREMCPVCGKFVALLSEHIRTHGTDEKYQCPYCEKDFITKSSWYRHLNIHTRAKEYKCEQCGKEFSQRNGLKAHWATHTKDRQYVCPVCEKSFYQRTSFYRHKRTHFEEPTIPCPECDHKFLCRGTMRNHLKKHLPREFACEICGRAFYRNSNLTTHMKIHQRKGVSSVRNQIQKPVPEKEG